MPFVEDYKIENGIITGQFDNVKKIELEFTADADGAVGSKTVNVGSAIVGVETTDTCTVSLLSVNGSELLGDEGVALNGRVQPVVDVYSVGGLTVTASDAPANATNSVILLVK